MNRNKSLLGFLALALILWLYPLVASAELQANAMNDGTLLERSLESVRDMDYQSWQVVVYRKDDQARDLVLRIIGYPGRVRLDHPTELIVDSGRRHWQLTDITLLNPQLAKDPRQAAAEFDLMPLLEDLTNNRPLRLHLDGSFSELPVPPYLVGEWRYLMDNLSS